MAEIDILRISASLISILALIFLLAWMVRRIGWVRGGSSRPMHLVSTQSLGPRAQLAMVEVGGRCLVLGVTAHQVTLLDTLPAEQVQRADASELSSSFAGALKAVLQRGA
ncbi:flagellar biosynthetic protein FliO [Paracandidimonas soli]|uniref:Flagellar protein n=1 Tax=Paracandidimonas soli TaxID=1917182 RepID=A0A4V2VS29_9BURK|nr:flagellar biosynthetic protein FliO [Paracandidimonas soli]TCV00820.1 flagellar protein FliO/FliZ [Paracandidimonas soli]